ncbi:hypothetical protein BT63DRAFT_414290 [Microthyrium microscopicum]|uniref:RING-CH-type domain-containing protein n=1 Tax=Microthyrium microscopicum TaxID=703497 RepID=A0A6A6UAD6_9PEZI|nr:hypothetical protein BT63DRAFT_414290 [Microthyrium microscopicum]
MDDSTSTGRMPGEWEWPDFIRQRRQDPTPDTPTPPPTSSSAHQPSDPPPSTTSNSPPSTSSDPPPSSSRPGSKPRTWRPRQCRICLDTVLPTFHPPADNVPGFMQGSPRVSYEDESGRLISPCKCRGSSRYVHENCLQQWRLSNPQSTRNYFECPTCKYKYRLGRLGWSNMITSIGSQIALTVLIFLTVIFILGFVADSIIDFCLDPWGSIWRGITFQSYRYAQDNYYYDDDLDSTWLEHFGRGFASLGLLSFFKAALASPIQFWFRTANMGGRRNAGRDRLGGVTWLVILIGAFTFMLAVWKGVSYWSRRILERAGAGIADVQNVDDGDDEDD